jgi:hypothetical protein
MAGVLSAMSAHVRERSVRGNRVFGEGLRTEANGAHVGTHASPVNSIMADGGVGESTCMVMQCAV